MEQNENLNEETLPSEDTAQTEETVPSAEDEQAKIAEEYRKYGIADPSGERSIDEIADLLSTFEQTEGSAPAPKAKRFNRRRAVISAVIGGAAVLCLVLYFTVLRPIFVQETPTQTVKVSEVLYPSTEEERAKGTAEAIYQRDFDDVLTLTDEMNPETGEGLGIMIFRPVDWAELQSVEVSNETGTFAFDSDKKGSFVLRGAEDYEVGTELFSILQTTVCNPTIQMRVRTDCTEQDYAEFGLSEKDDVIRYTVTTLAGVSHTVTLGKMSPSEGGYYARYEGRPVVYLLGSVMKITLTQDEKQFLTPLASPKVGVSAYSKQEELTLYRNGEKLMSAKLVDPDKRDTVTTTRMFTMTYPANQPLSSSTFDTDLLQTLSTLEPTAVLDYKLTEERLADWGLNPAPFAISYTLEGVEVDLLVSDLREDGTYAVYSNVFDMVTQVPADTFKFVDYDLIDYVERPIFSRMITDIRSIAIKGDGIDTRFELTHHSGDKNNPLEVMEAVSGTVIEDIPNFRNLYKDLLSVKIEAESPYNEKTLPDTSATYCSVEVRTAGGAVIRFAFHTYPEKDLSLLYTFNDEGSFDVGRGTVEKLLNDTVKCLNGEKIDPDGRK